MDDRPDTFHTAAPSSPDEVPAARVLAACPDDHAVAVPLLDALADLGVDVRRVPSVYHAVVALAVDPEAFAAVVLAVDYFNRDELRFFPMASRRWPHLRTVAVAEPSFAYKTSIAGLAGAGVTCSDPALAADAADQLARDLPVAAPEPTAETAPSDLAPPPPGRPEPAPPRIRIAPAPLDADHIADDLAIPTAELAPPSDDERRALQEEALLGDELDDDLEETEVPAPPPVVAERRPPRPAPMPEPPPRRTPSTREILTEEEISALMADMDDTDADRDNTDRTSPRRLPRNGTDND